MQDKAATYKAHIADHLFLDQMLYRMPSSDFPSRYSWVRDACIYTIDQLADREA